MADEQVTTAEEVAPGDLRAERFWSVGFPVLIVVLSLSVPALLITGRNVVLHSTEGSVERQVTDPSAPGWAAYAEPTPVALVLHRTATGALVGVTLASLTGDTTGAVVFVPVDTVVAGDARGRTLAEVAADGEDPLRRAVEAVVGFTPSDLVTLDPAGWREALATVGPLAVENPDAVFEPGPGDRPVLRFPTGRLVLRPDEVADYLSLRNAGERDLNRLVRHEAFWRAWLKAAGSAPGGPGPGSGGAGGPLERYVRALASGTVEMATLPVQGVATTTGTGAEQFTPVAGQARALLGRLVPFPVGGPTARLRIRLLDGVGGLHHGLDAAAALVGRGGQIDQIGNAGSFGQPRTRLELADERLRPRVEELVAALGVGEVQLTTTIPGDTDVVVTLGQDYVDARGAGRGGTGG